jgi:hypothetical protein
MEEIDGLEDDKSRASFGLALVLDKTLGTLADRFHELAARQAIAEVLEEAS